MTYNTSSMWNQTVLWWGNKFLFQFFSIYEEIRFDVQVLWTTSMFPEQIMFWILQWWDNHGGHLKVREMFVPFPWGCTADL